MAGDEHNKRAARAAAKLGRGTGACRNIRPSRTRAGANATRVGAHACKRVGAPMSMDLLLNAIVAGLLLGGFYAAVTVGLSISFGMLDVVNIAHPAFIIIG